MKSTAPILCALTATLIGCASPQPARLVLLNRSTGDRYVGAVVPDQEGAMTVSIEINHVFFSGRFDPSNGNTGALLVGSGGDVLHCDFHIDQKARTGTGECLRAGPQRFDVTLSNQVADREDGPRDRAKGLRNGACGNLIARVPAGAARADAQVEKLAVEKMREGCRGV
jgi:hypothetical protein